MIVKRFMHCQLLLLISATVSRLIRNWMIDIILVFSEVL